MVQKTLNPNAPLNPITPLNHITPFGAAVKDATSTQSDHLRDAGIWLSRPALIDSDDRRFQQERREAAAWISRLPEARRFIKEDVLVDQTTFIKVDQQSSEIDLDIVFEGEAEKEELNEAEAEEQEEEDPLNLLCDLIPPQPQQPAEGDDDSGAEWIVSIDPDQAMAGLFSPVEDGHQLKSIFTLWTDEEEGSGDCKNASPSPTRLIYHGSSLEPSESIDRNLTPEPSNGITRNVITIEPSDGIARNVITIEPSDGIARNVTTIEPSDGIARNVITIEPSDGITRNLTTIEPLSVLTSECTSDRCMEAVLRSRAPFYSDHRDQRHPSNGRFHQHGPYSWHHQPPPSPRDAHEWMRSITKQEQSILLPQIDRHVMERIDGVVEELMRPDRLASPGDRLVLLSLEVWTYHGGTNPDDKMGGKPIDTKMDGKPMDVERHINLINKVDDVPYLPNPKTDPIRLAVWTRLDLHTGMTISGSISSVTDNSNTLDDGPLIREICGMVIATDADVLLGYYVEAEPAVASSWEYLNRRAAVRGIDLVACLSRTTPHNPTRKIHHHHHKDAPPPNLHRIDGRMVGSVWRMLSNDAVFSGAHTDYSFEAIVRARLGLALPLHREFLSESRALWYFGLRTRLSLALIAELMGRACEFARLFGLASLEEVFTRGSQYRVESLMMRMSRLEGQGEDCCFRCAQNVDRDEREQRDQREHNEHFASCANSDQCAHNANNAHNSNNAHCAHNSHNANNAHNAHCDQCAHNSSFLAISPSRAQVKSMAAARAMPLTLEPRSGLWVEPVLVFDFQSLYPSLMISHNYCFTTCLGIIPPTLNTLSTTTIGDGPRPYGAGCWIEATGLDRGASSVKIAPTGAAFVGTEVREGLLPRMLSELLEARVQVKRQMKQLGGSTTPDHHPAYRRLNASQLGLKYMANVIYGYTAAAFSGRMPSVEVADSIVSSGRAALQRAIRLVEEDPRWAGRLEVIYGDTDSLFVRVKGKAESAGDTGGDSLREARLIGREIAETVTAAFPRPMKLVFEKIYWPCLLMSKKRYAGWRWEPVRTEAEPEALSRDAHSQCAQNGILTSFKFEAKGTESIRRDGAPIVTRVLNEALEVLFRTRNLSLVKRLLEERFWEIRQACQSSHAIDRIVVPWSDFVIRRTVRSLEHYKGTRHHDDDNGDGHCDDRSDNGNHRLPPAALVAVARRHRDLHDGVAPGERVPFIVVAEARRSQRQQRQRLTDACMDPSLLFCSSRWRPDGDYYIDRQVIPALRRALQPIIGGAEMMAWWRELTDDSASAAATTTTTTASDDCKDDNQSNPIRLAWRRRQEQVFGEALRRSAWNCCHSTIRPNGSGGLERCWSLSCPNLWRSVCWDDW